MPHRSVTEKFVDAQNCTNTVAKIVTKIAAKIAAQKKRDMKDT